MLERKKSYLIKTLFFYTTYSENIASVINIGEDSWDS